MQNPRSVLDEIADVRDLRLDQVPTRPRYATVVLADPSYFDLQYAINPHMGGTVDPEEARQQWEQLREVYERHADDVLVLDPAETWQRLDGGVAPPADQPDMVFVANHAVPTADGDGVVLSRMATEERADEPAYFGSWARRHGYEVRPAPGVSFEGAGDARWHPGRRLVWGGHGIRTDRAAYDELPAALDATVVPLELVDERYFHLDLCLLPLSETTALYQPEAFTEPALAKLDAGFETLVEAPTDEALERFAVNATVVGGTVVAGTGTPETTARLETAGYDVVSVDTDEFLKAGGSISCLTLRLGSA